MFKHMIIKFRYKLAVVTLNKAYQYLTALQIAQEKEAKEATKDIVKFENDVKLLKAKINEFENPVKVVSAFK